MSCFNKVYYCYYLHLKSHVENVCIGQRFYTRLQGPVAISTATFWQRRSDDNLLVANLHTQSQLPLYSNLNVKQLDDNNCFCSVLYTLIVVLLSDQGPQELATGWLSLVSYPILIPLLLSGFRISLGLFLFNQFLLEYG